MYQQFRIFATSPEDTREQFQPATWQETQERVTQLTQQGYENICVKTQVDMRQAGQAFVPDFFEFLGYSDANFAVWQWKVES